VPNFEAFGPDHVAALVVTALLGGGAIAVARAGDSPRLPRALALLIAVAQLCTPLVDAQVGRLSWQKTLPIELCDIASFATIFALWTRRQGPFEFCWFWGLSGTALALLTPPIEVGFAHPEYVRFFAMHGGIVVGALYLGPGLGLRPRPGSAWRVYKVTAAYALAVGLLDWAIGANYFFLCSKPPGSVLDHFGPWPVYIGGGALIAACAFFLLERVARGPARA
jgi:hypothetical integral membrane protein (TIGR02206 family)